MMAEVATTITVGGKKTAVPVMNFRTLQEVWGLVASFRDATDLIAKATITARMMAAAVRQQDPTMTDEAFMTALIGDEWSRLDAPLLEMLKASGFEFRTPQPGEASQP